MNGIAEYDIYMRYEKLKKIAMDLEEVYMTTNLGGEATFFLPFNMWQGTGAGIPVKRRVQRSLHMG